MSKDIDFASSLTEAWVDKEPTASKILMLVLVLLFGSFFTWASLMELDISTRGVGSVVPSESVYVIDNLEGGILAEMLVEEGQLVTEGQVLLRIDNSSYKAALQENLKKQLALKLSLLRLTAEQDGKAFTVDDNAEFDETMMSNELQFYKARKQQNAEKKLAYKKQITETEQEFNETESLIIRLTAEVEGKKLKYSKAFQAKAKESVAFEQRHYKLRQKYLNNETKRLKKSLALLKQEHKSNQELEKLGAASEMDVIRLQRQVLETEGKLTQIKENFLQKASQELKETRAKKIEQIKAIAGLKSSLIDFNKQRLSEIAGEMRQTESELVLTQEQQKSLQDKVDRSAITSPINGIVNKRHISSVGAVIQSGKEILEITPVSKGLLVEVAIAPKDIAFIHQKQKAVVKVTAYDFAIYGGLEGDVLFISPDTHENEKGDPFYKVQIRTQSNQIGKNTKNLIIPGMAVEVDLISGKRSLMDYMLKPLRRMSEEAFHER